MLGLIDFLHAQAVEQGKACYTDPLSGYQVMTRDSLAKRGYCCKSGCRHCPWGFTR
ncbi:MAG: hypothetical protein K2X01_06550 [Cyanobacteria bacterium]|nr:hypothetical protein [Cyanobacteriota bacterium]